MPSKPAASCDRGAKGFREASARPRYESEDNAGLIIERRTVERVPREAIVKERRQRESKVKGTLGSCRFATGIPQRCDMP